MAQVKKNIQKFQGGGTNPASATATTSTPTTNYGKLIMSGTEYDFNDKNVRNNFIDFAKNNDSGVYGEILNKIDRGENVNYNMLNHTLENFGELSGLNERQNEKIGKRASGWQKLTASLNPGSTKVEKSRQAVYDLKNFANYNSTPVVTDTPSLVDYKTPSLTIDYAKDKSGNMVYQDTVRNNSILQRLDDMFEFFNRETAEAGSVLKSTKFNSDFNFTDLFNYSKTNENFISGLKDRIKSNTLTEADKSNLELFKIKLSGSDPSSNPSSKTSNVPWFSDADSQRLGITITQNPDGTFSVKNADGTTFQDSIITDLHPLYGLNSEFNDGVVDGGILYKYSDLNTNNRLGSKYGAFRTHLTNDD